MVQCVYVCRLRLHSHPSAAAVTVGAAGGWRHLVVQEENAGVSGSASGPRLMYLFISESFHLFYLALFLSLSLALFLSPVYLTSILCLPGL